MITRVATIYEALEKKRKQLNMTESELCLGICSVRTYRRYIYEDTEMPFIMLEKLLAHMDMNIYNFLYFIEHKIKMKHWDEVILLNALIQDDYEHASLLYKTFIDKKHVIQVSPFLLPLMLKKLEAFQNGTAYDAVHKEMIEALHLNVLIKRPFLTTDHIKLIEHIMPFALKEDKMLIEVILKRILDKSVTLIRASKYTYVKCHQLYFQSVLEHAPIHEQVKTCLQTLKAVYEIGGELAIDEVLLLAKSHDLHLKDERMHHLLKTYYFASSFMYIDQNPWEEQGDVEFMMSFGFDAMLKPSTLYEDIKHALY